jgi:hypothetical protein
MTIGQAFFDRVRFAMALPTWKEARPHDVSKAIVGAELEQYIDFEKSRETDLALTLTDSDLCQILTCVEPLCYRLRNHGQISACYECGEHYCRTRNDSLLIRQRQLITMTIGLQMNNMSDM